ncbi:hypothetical protein C6990_01825 [Nitrosopumilus sp. b3]|uniref:hypothetical protein n=1 Tax=Nitrosopumilus sp. b3 TaxID=2109909 RepID=UPI0015F73F46|nr:hypothetical protein [Nitrosopumilus sp. b3]KAF6248198.1 hypothetical protein C6990_01825 [Nitrosopumilus sp. b3]
MAINYKIILLISVVSIIGLFFLTQIKTDDSINESDSKQSDMFFDFNIDTKNIDLIELPIDSIFQIYGVRDEYIIDGNYQKYSRLLFELDPNNKSLYKELKNTDEKTIVIFPTFTATAYNSPGFYNYYNGLCDETCLSVPIVSILRTEIGGNGAQILKLLNYNFLSDVDIDKNPKILAKFDKVILLHNEYVTKKQFDAITSHPNVIYLYPNALHAEIEVDYDSNTITLIRGHGYADKYNGFDWEFDNTQPYEYDLDCNDWEFYEIPNGKMLNCFPERQLYEDDSLLRALKEL